MSEALNAVNRLPLTREHYDKIKSARKLQELVKDGKILLMIDINNVETRAEAMSIGEFIERLQSLIEESEK